MARLRQRLLKLSIVLVAVVVLVIVGAAILLTTSWAKNKIREKVQTLASEAINGQLQINTLKGSLYSGIETEGILILDKAGRPALELPSLTVDYSLRNILNRRIDVSNIAIDDPVIYLRVHKDGTTNLQSLIIPSEDEASDFSVVVDSLALRRGRVIALQDAHPESPIEINEVDLDAVLQIESQNIEFIVQQLSAEIPAYDTSLQMKARLSQDEEGIHLNDVAVRAGESTLDLDSFSYSEKLPPEPNESPLRIHVAKKDVQRWASFSDLPSDLDLDVTLIFGLSIAEPWSLTGVLRSKLPRIGLSAWVNPRDKTAGGQLRIIGFNPQSLELSFPKGAINLYLKVATSWAGDSSNFIADSHLDVNGSLMGVHISEGRVNAKVGEKTADFDASFETDSGPMKGSGQVDYSGSEPIISNGHVDAKLNLRRVKRHIRGLNRISGQLRLNATVSGAISELNTKGRVDVTQLHYLDTRIKTGRAGWDLNFKPGAPLGRVNLAVKELRYGEIAIPAATFELAPKATGSQVKGNLRANRLGELSLKGFLSQKRGVWSFAVEGLQATFAKVRWRGNQGLIKRFASGRIFVDKLALQNKKGSLVTSLDWRPGHDFPRTFKFVAMAIDFESAIPEFLKTGELSSLKGVVDISLRSDSKEPMSGSAKLTNVAWSEDLSPITATIGLNLSRTRQGRISLTASHDGFEDLNANVSFEGPKSWRSLAAWKRLGVTHINESSLELRQLNLEAFRALTKVDELQGVMNLSFKGGQGLDQSELSVETLGISGPNVSIENRINGALKFSFDRDSARLHVDMRSASGGTLNGGMTASTDRANFLLSLPKLKLEHVQDVQVSMADLALASWLPVAHLEGLGETVFSGDLAYSPRTDRLSIKALVASSKTESSLGVRVGLELTGNERELSTLVQAGTSDEQDIVKANFTLNKGVRTIINAPSKIGEAALSGTLKMKGFDFGQAARLTTGQEFDGRINANIKFAGLLAKPVADGTIELKRLRYENVPMPKMMITAKSAKDDTDLYIEIAQSRGTLSTHIKGVGAENVAFEVQATNFGLRFLNPLLLTMEIPVAGLDGAINGSVSGQVGAQPKELRGHFTLKDGTVGFPRPIEPLHHVDLKVEIEEGRAALNVKARSGKGKLSGDIDIALKNGLPLGAKGLIKTDALPVATKGLSAGFTGSIALNAGRQNGQWLAGVKIKDGQVQLKSLPSSGKLHPSDPLSDVVYVDEDVEIKKENKKIHLRVNVETEGEPLLVRGDKVNVYAKIDVQTDSTAEQVHIGGKTSIVNGYVELFDRRYMVDQARVVFDEKNIDDSSMDLKISRDFPEVRVVVEIYGTIGVPELKMSTEPPIYSQAQIISLIINGVPGGQAGKDSANDAALSAIAGLVSQQLASAIKEPIGVDSLEFSTDDGGKISSVSVGKWISDKIFLAYYRHFEADPNENQDEAVLEWWLSPTWLMELRGGDAGAASGDLLWIWRY